MPLRKRQRTQTAATATPLEPVKETKTRKRERFLKLFRGRRQQPQQADLVDKHTPEPAPHPAPQAKPPRDSKIGESTERAKSTSSVDVARPKPAAEQDQPAPLPTPPPETKPEDETISEAVLHKIFAGAPQFTVKRQGDRLEPAVAYPWDDRLTVRDVSDSQQFAEPAYSSSTLRRHLPAKHVEPSEDRPYLGYDAGVVEVPSMLSAQGIEPGTIGFAHFLQLPISDNLVTDLQQSQSSNGVLESVRNKELMQTNPEKLGIRRIDMEMIHDRLIQFGDLLEVFEDSPERMTILSNQSSGDLYANLFGRFLTPPPFDNTVDDPTGIKVQIDTLLKILRMKGVWYDFSLVEWRIRVGQILWGDPDAVVETEVEASPDSQPLWSDREILLVQITLACELLLRLDAVATMDIDQIKGQVRLTSDEYENFKGLKTRKTDWDLVLARRFLDNILVVKDSDTPQETTKPKGILGILSRDNDKSDSAPDVVFLPRHQARQLSGLFHFAETLHWPGMDVVLTELRQKLGTNDIATDGDVQPSPKFLDPTTPSSISVYGTPLATPRSPDSAPNGYFGHMTKPALSRNDTQRSLQVPLNSALTFQADKVAPHSVNVGGWLSRSFLTGLVLPGEPIAHFLISTLLENDKLAIAALGDSANLYGGFVYADKTFWSKSSVVGRVLACLDGATECMGWISVPRLPESQAEGWYAVHSREVAFEQPTRVSAEEDIVARDSALAPNGNTETVKPADLSLRRDKSTPPVPSVQFVSWNLMPLTAEGLDDQATLGSAVEPDTFTASLLFTSNPEQTLTHRLTLAHDVQFITSQPCSPPASTPNDTITETIKHPPTGISSSADESKRHSRNLSRRNSHGFEPLLSHPPNSPGIEPVPAYFSFPEGSFESVNAKVALAEHPVHTGDKCEIVPVPDLLEGCPNLLLTMISRKSSHSSQRTQKLADGNQRSSEDIQREKIANKQKSETRDIVVLDARGSIDLELFARAWCAEKGQHAIVGRVGRTCLGCCVREARGLGVNVVIRV